MRRDRLTNWFGLRAGLVAAGLILLAMAWLLLAPDRWLGSVVPTHTAGTTFNLGLLAELRVSLALVGLLCLALGLFPSAPHRLAEHLAAPLAAVDRWLRKGKRWTAHLLTCCTATGALFASYSIARHNAFNSKAYDLGLHAQVFWNTSQGRLFASSIEVSNYLGDHVSPIILLLAPIYRVWPDPRGLLILQAVTLASGALPLALLTRRLVKPAWPDGAHLASLAIALIFLTYPALGFVNRFEFHEEVLVVPLLLGAFWALETRRLRVMSLALALAMLTKEDVGLTVAAFGLWAWWCGRQENASRIGTDEHGSEQDRPQRIMDPLAPQSRFTEPPTAKRQNRRLQTFGLLWAFTGVAWSLIALFVVIPAMRGVESDTLARYAWLGSGPADILASVIQDPGRVAGHVLGEPRRIWMLIKLLLPVGFLPLLSPAVLIALPTMAINWLAGNLYQASIYFHYATLLIPIVFAAAVYGMKRVATSRVAFQAPRFTLTLLWLTVCALLAIGFDQFWQAQTGQDDWPNYSLTRQIDPAPFRTAAALLPADGAVATTEAYASHLANRQGLYLLHDPRILFVVDQVDWVLVDLNDLRYGVQPRAYYGLLRWVADVRGLGVCYFADDVVLLGPGCDEGVTAAAFKERLLVLQQHVAGNAVNPTLVEFVGADYFHP